MTAGETRSVADWVAEKPTAAQIFEQHQIDYCCNGHRTLEEASCDAGVSIDALLAELSAAPVSDEVCDWRLAPLAELADHIVKRHHTYLRSTLPSISDKLGKVMEAHREHHGELLGRLQEIFGALSGELTQHMMKEEIVLFPLVKSLEAAEREKAAPPPAPGGSVNNPIHMMEHEHDDAGRALEQIRRLTGDYMVPADACNTFRALYQQLEELEGDLHRHIHRVDWDSIVELIAVANIYTIKKWGPDCIAGFSPIPAMSMISYAGGARMLQLMGGVSLSFYDWYCDLPPASPETWGEQTDVHESADWFNAKLLAVMGANLNMTRTPDCHFAAEARYNGTKMWVFSPDFSQVSKYADEWVGLNAGQDGAWWMAVNHVILKEFHHDKQIPYFADYVRKYTDAPYLVVLDELEGGAFRPGRLLRANRLAKYADVENGDWQFLMWDEAEGGPKMPLGSVGFRWAKKKGKWNLQLKDGLDGSDIDPALTFLDEHDGVAQVSLDDFGEARTTERGVPFKRLKTADGSTVVVATAFDLLMAQYGVPRGLPGQYPADYNDENAPYTPAWSEKYTGMGRATLIRFAREWARTAELTKGKCTIIIGAGINHWYHNNLMYRAGIHALMFCGCVGVNGGGLAHYVGQEKLAPMESWSSIALAKDWFPPSRVQNAPSWHYVHTDQWRYEKEFTDYHTVPKNGHGPSLAGGHTMDLQVKAVRNGWLPFYPQFDRSSLDVVREAEQAGTASNEEIVSHTVERLKAKTLKFAVEDPDAPENWPRVWFIWRRNALMSSAKGHEYFLKHYLGTHTNAIAEDLAQDSVKDAVWHEKAPQGKMDLVVDLNFRMDTSALYSDIVLPAATWYEKSDLNSTDLHSFIHPLSAAVPPCWESKSDWQIFQTISKKFSELAEKHFPEPVRDIVAAALAHDTPAEIAQPEIRDWALGASEAIPGKTMPGLKVVTRDYKNLYRQFISYGRMVRENGLGAHGTHYDAADLYDEAVMDGPRVSWDGKAYPSLAEDIHVCDQILRFATVTNGELAYRSYKNMEEKTGLPLVHLAEKSR